MLKSWHISLQKHEIYIRRTGYWDGPRSGSKGSSSTGSEFNSILHYSADQGKVELVGYESIVPPTAFYYFGITIDLLAHAYIAFIKLWPNPFKFQKKFRCAWQS